MKVKVINKFIDKHTGKVHKAGDILDIKKDRFEEIRKVADNLVEEIPEEPKKPAKKAAKKEAE